MSISCIVLGSSVPGTLSVLNWDSSENVLEGDVYHFNDPKATLDQIKVFLNLLIIFRILS